jgi:hypothetical protein
VTVDAALAATGQNVDIFGDSITTTANGTITANSAPNQTVTLTSGTSVQIDGTVVASGLFTSTGGTTFLNEGTGSITASGILISHAGGSVKIDAALTSTATDVDIFGASIETTAAGTITATSAGNQAVTLTSGSFVQIDGQVQATGLFTSTGGSTFLNEGTGSITASGILISHANGSVTVDAALTATSLPVDIFGASITTTANGTITANSVGGQTVTLTSGSSVQIDGQVQASGLFTSSGGTTFLNEGTGSITALGVLIEHSGGDVTFNAFIDGTAGDVIVNGINITSSTDGTINGAIITLTASGNVELNGVVTGSGLFTSTGVNFLNTASITAAGITVDHTGAVSVHGALDALANDILITGTSIESNIDGTMNGDVITLTATAGDVTVGGEVTGSGLFTSTGQNFTNTASITGLGITVDHTGDVLFDAAIDGLTGAVDVNGHKIKSTTNGTIHGAAITLDADTSVTLGGTVVGTGQFHSTGTTFTNTASVSASGITLTHTGLVTFSANLTAGGGSGPMAVTGAGVNQTDGIIKAGTLVLHGTGNFSLAKENRVSKIAADITGPLDFHDATSLTVGKIGAVTGLITHDGAVRIHLSSGDLLVNQQIFSGVGGITFEAPTGSVTINGLLTTTGGFSSTGINFVNNTPIITSSIQIHHTGAARIAANLTATSGNIIDDATTTLGANLKAAGNIRMPQHVLLVNGPRTVVAGGATGITFGSEGGIDGGSPGEDLFIKTTDMADKPKIVLGRMGSEAMRLGNIHVASAYDVVLNGDIHASTLFFEDAIPGPAPSIPTLATISHKGDLLIDVNGLLSAPQGVGAVPLPPGASSDTLLAGADFFMERGQKLSVFGSGAQAGNLVIRTHNRNMVVGDIAALGKLTLDAGSTNQSITILNRPASQVLLPNGVTTTLDHGTDIVAGFPGTGAMTIIGKVFVNQFVGATPSDRVQIAAFAGSADLNPTFGKLEFDQNSTSVILTVNSTNVLSAADFQGPGTLVLDIIAHGVGNNPSSSQGSVIPRDVQSFSPEHNQAISGAMVEMLRQIGIFARAVRNEEIVEALVGRALYDDVPLKLAPVAEDNTVAANRLPFQPVFPTIDAYQKLFFTVVIDSKGNPVLGPDGKPKTETRDSAIKDTLGLTWRAYSSADKNATPEGFRAWLESLDKSDPRNAEALNYINQLRDLLAAVKNLGITNIEFEISKATIFARSRPSNIRESDFMTVITGPSTRRALTSR